MCATNEGLYARCRKYKTGSLRFDFVAENGTIESFSMNLDIEELSELVSKGGFFSYVAGTAAAMLQDHFFNANIDPNDHSAGIYIVNYRTTLPMKKGLF